MIKIRSGGATVTLNEASEAFVRKIINEAAPGIFERIDAALADMKRNAEASWPVGREDENYLKRHPEKRNRPHSRDMFYTETVITAPSSGRGVVVMGRIWNTSKDKQGRPYWLYIRAHKLRGGNPAVAFVRKPMETLRDDLRWKFPQIALGALKKNG